MRYKITYGKVHTYVYNGVELDGAVHHLLKHQSIGSSEIKIEVSTSFETIDPKTLKMRASYHRGVELPWNPKCPAVVVRRRDRLLIDGYMRVQAAIAAGIKEIKVEFVEE